jgi:flagella basal body P-ring formation protein FlgA
VKAGFLGFITGVLFALSSYGATPSSSSHPGPTLGERLKAELSRKFPGTKIVLDDNIQGSVPGQIDQVSLVDENSRGEARFLVSGTSGDQKVQTELQTRFAALAPALVATRRIQPGEKLSRDLFTHQEVNVASGMAREFRGVMLPESHDLSRLESRQTILAGQFATFTAVQKVPDIRRGEAVRVQMQSGEIRLSTQGVAQEPAYLDGQIRILTQKTKRELVGKLKANGIVEVQL